MAARPPTPPFPDLYQNLVLPISHLPAYIDQLAAPSHYDLLTHTARARILLVLLPYIFDPRSRHRALFLPDLDPDVNVAQLLKTLDDEWSLVGAQQASASSSTSAKDDEYSPSRRGKPCGHVFKAGESVYRCRDCGLDPTCVLCARCFHASSHSREGHDVTVSTHAGVGAGCCDCGDLEAWKEGRQRDCKYHGEVQGEDKGKGRAVDDGRDEQLEEEAKERVKETLGAALDWAISVFERSPSTFSPPRSVDELLGLVPPSAPLPVIEGDYDGEDTSALLARQAALQARMRIIEELQEAAEAATEQLEGAAQPMGLDDDFDAPEADDQPPSPTLFAATTTRAFPQPQPVDEAHLPTHVRAAALAELQNALGTRVRVLHHARTDETLAELPPPTSLPGSFPSLSSSAPPSSAVETNNPDDPKPSYAVILWNDEKHSFTQVIDQVSRAVGCSRRAAMEVAQRVDIVGRDIVLITSDAAEAVRVAKKIKEIDLATTVRKASDAWEEQVAGWLIGVVSRDLAKARFGGDAGGLEETVAAVWVERKEGEESRWMRLARCEAKLWKGLRKEIQEKSVGLMGVGVDVRAELGLQYSVIYPNLAQSYLLTDREPEHSLIFFGVQVFTVPSVCVALLSQSPTSFLSTLLSLLYSFFTGQFTPTRRSLTLPPSYAPDKAKVDLDKNPFLKQKRYFQLFSDLHHLLSSPAVQVALVNSSSALEELSTFFALFEGMNPQTRAVGTHVEYESDAWVSAFNLSIQLARTSRCFGEAFSKASPVQLARGLSVILQRISNLPTAPDSTEFRTLSFPPGSSKVDDETYSIPTFSVAERSNSYHHPMAWLWAEMVKYSTALNVEEEGGEARFSERQLQAFGARRFEDVLIGGKGGPERFQKALEGPLRTIALVAQVRSGVWVRNGFGIRAQNLHYKEYSLRENTYDQDLFFLQTSLVALPDPSLAITSILDRFDLLEWLSTTPQSAEFAHPSYETDQTLAMMDELLNLLLTLTTDPIYTVPLPPLFALRRELVHYLALGPSVYSDLLRHLSERFSDDPNIDRVLSQVARFKPPTGSTDQGTYTLRDECYDEVEPYFSRYSRNQREEADKVVRAALKRDQKGERARGRSDDPVVLPKKLTVSPETSGPFVRLREALGSKALLLTIFYALQAATTRGDKFFSDSIVDLALQLALVAFVEQPEAFARFAVETISSDTDDQPSVSLIDVLIRIEEEDRLSAVSHKASWLLDRLVDLHGHAVSSLRRQGTATSEEDGKAAAQVEMEAKRAAAKKRQEAIMKQFQQAQSAFLQNVEDDEDDEDGEKDEADEDGETTMRDTEDVAPPRPKTHFGSCIVCQDELEDSAPFGILGLVQGSNLVRHTPTGEGNAPFQQEILALPASLDRDLSDRRPYGIAGEKVPVGGFTDSSDGLARGFPQSQKQGLHASSCGHMMHLACFDRYYRSVEQRHQQQPTRCHPEDVERREFTCPLCKSLGNVLLPAEVESPAFLPYSGTFDSRNLAEWSRPDADPIEDGEGTGASLSRFDDTFLHRVDKLSILSDPDQASYLKPCRASMSLAMLLSEQFKDAEGQMTARLIQVVTALHQEVGGPGSSVATLSKDLVGYTISTLEIASRGTAEPAWALSESNARLLQSLVGVMQALVELMTQSTDSARIAAVSVKQRLGGLFSTGSKFEGIEFTTFDPLGSVIEAGVCMPSAFYHVVAVAFYSALAQNYLSVYRMFHESTSVSDIKSASDEEASEYLSLEAMRAFFPQSSSPALFDQERIDFRLTLGKHLHAQQLVFLRRAAVVARVVLGEPSEDATDAFMDDEDHSEFSRLLTFLRIPTPREVLSTDTSSIADPTVLALRAHLSACHDSIASTILAPSSSPSSASAIELAVDRLLNSSVPELEHPTVYELLGLPNQLDTLVAASLEQECKRCGTVPHMPALCLFCGEMVCAQSFCCMVGEDEAANGECNEHMWTCGGSVAIYYLIKRNTILYLSTTKGAFAAPPYLDLHGENRARSTFQQFLHSGRYEAIRKLWLTGAISTFVARKLEGTTDNGGWNSM